LIVDASALISGLVREESFFEGSQVAAPDLLIPEALNALWKLGRAGVSCPKLAIVLDVIDSIRIHASRPYAARAAELANELGHPVYDCFYLALAEAEGDVLLSADVRLARKLARTPLRRRVRLLEFTR
jgi:predicted nucleic acid-binding protein